MSVLTFSDGSGLGAALEVVDGTTADVDVVDAAVVLVVTTGVVGTATGRSDWLQPARPRALSATTTREEVAAVDRRGSVTSANYRADTQEAAVAECWWSSGSPWRRARMPSTA